MKPEELAFAKAMVAAHGNEPYKGNSWRPEASINEFEDIAKTLGIPGKRAFRWLEKWSDKNWWEYGVSVRTGWFTPSGIAHFMSQR